MKYVLLSFLLLITNQLLGADQEAMPAARAIPVSISYRDTDLTIDIEISRGSVSYPHSFPLIGLQIMDKPNIRQYVMSLLTGASVSDGLSEPQKSMIATLRHNELQISEIVTFLFNHSRVASSYVAIDYSPRWGKAH